MSTTSSVTVKIVFAGGSIEVIKDNASSMTLREALDLAERTLSDELVYRSRASLLDEDSELHDGDTVLEAAAEKNG